MWWSPVKQGCFELTCHLLLTQESFSVYSPDVCLICVSRQLCVVLSACLVWTWHLCVLFGVSNPFPFDILQILILYFPPWGGFHFSHRFQSAAGLIPSYYKLNWAKRASAVYSLLGTLLYPCRQELFTLQCATTQPAFAHSHCQTVRVSEQSLKITFYNIRATESTAHVTQFTQQMSFL